MLLLVKEMLLGVRRSLRRAAGSLRLGRRIEEIGTEWHGAMWTRQVQAIYHKDFSMIPSNYRT